MIAPHRHDQNNRSTACGTPARSHGRLRGIGPRENSWLQRAHAGVPFRIRRTRRKNNADVETATPRRTVIGGNQYCNPHTARSDAAGQAVRLVAKPGETARRYRRFREDRRCIRQSPRDLALWRAFASAKPMYAEEDSDASAFRVSGANGARFLHAAGHQLGEPRALDDVLRGRRTRALRPDASRRPNVSGVCKRTRLLQQARDIAVGEQRKILRKSTDLTRTSRRNKLVLPVNQASSCISRRPQLADRCSRLFERHRRIKCTELFSLPRR